MLSPSLPALTKSDEGLCPSPSALSGASTGLWWDDLSQDTTVEVVALELLGLQSLAHLHLSLPHTSCDSSFWISPGGVILPKLNYGQVNLITLLTRMITLQDFLLSSEKLNWIYI